MTDHLSTNMMQLESCSFASSEPSPNFISVEGSRSVAWKYCQKGVGDKTGFSRCTICMKEIKSTASNTTGLINHLRRAHNIEIPRQQHNSLVNVSSPVNGNSPLVNSNSPVNVIACKERTIEEIVANLLTVRGFTLEQIANTPDLVVQGLRMPDDVFLTRAMFVEFTEEVKGYNRQHLASLRSQDVKFALALEGVSLSKYRKILNIILHGPDLSYHLGIVQFRNGMSSEMLLQSLKERLEQYFLTFDSDVISMTSNETEAFGASTVPQHVFCMATGVHLAVCSVVYCNDQKIPGYRQYKMSDSLISSDESSDNESFEDDNDHCESLPVRYPKLQPHLSQVFKKIKRHIKTVHQSSESLQALQVAPTKSDIVDEPIKGINERKKWEKIPFFLKNYHRCYCNLYNQSQHVLTLDEMTMMVETYEALSICHELVELLCAAETNLYKAELAVTISVDQLNDLKSDIGKRLADAIYYFYKKRRNHKLMQLVNFLHNPCIMHQQVDPYGEAIDADTITSQAIAVIRRLQGYPEIQSEPISLDLEPNFLVSPPNKRLSLKERLEEEKSRIKQQSRQYQMLHINDLIKAEFYTYKTGAQNLPPTLAIIKRYMDAVPCNSISKERAFSSIGTYSIAFDKTYDHQMLDSVVVCRDFFKRGDSPINS